MYMDRTNEKQMVSVKGSRWQCANQYVEDRGVDVSVSECASERPTIACRPRLALRAHANAAAVAAAAAYLESYAMPRATGLSDHMRCGYFVSRRSSGRKRACERLDRLDRQEEMTCKVKEDSPHGSLGLFPALTWCRAPLQKKRRRKKKTVARIQGFLCPHGEGCRDPIPETLPTVYPLVCEPLAVHPPAPLTLHFWANEQGLRLRGVGNAKQRPGVPVLALLPSSHDGAPRYWVLGTGQATSSRQKGPSLGATVHTYRISLGVGLTNVGFVAANSN